MKLYTEEDVLKMLRSFHTLEMNVQLSMYKLTPIELPSDEEIWQEADKENFITQHYAFMRGTEWMKEQILKQNK